MKENLMDATAVLDALAADRARSFDINLPCQTRDGRRVLDLQLGSLDPRNPDRQTVMFRIQGEPIGMMRTKYARNGKGLIGDEVELPDDLVNLTVNETYTRRSLRQDRVYKLRDGRPVEFLSWDGDPENPCVVKYALTPEERRVMNGRSVMIAEYHKSGRIYPRGRDTPLDLIEINEVKTVWIRIYDKEPKIDAESGKQLVSEGRGVKAVSIKINAAIPLGWYCFATELEARSNLQGVRAVVNIEYRDGDGLDSAGDPA